MDTYIYVCGGNRWISIHTYLLIGDKEIEGTMCILGRCYMLQIMAFASSIFLNDVIIGTIASQITSLIIVHSTVYSYADQGKHQSSASPVNFPHTRPVTRKMFPFDDVFMKSNFIHQTSISNRSFIEAPSYILIKNELWQSCHRAVIFPCIIHLT